MKTKTLTHAQESIQNLTVGPSSGSRRVDRGGSWLNDASGCRVANRGSNSPGNRTSGLGFRVVCLP